MEKIIELITYFIIYSFMGWVIESVFKTILQKEFINSGFLHGPFCPIYGIGALIMFLFLQDYKGNPILIFCLGFVVLSVWEYMVGVFLEKVFKTKYWDYSQNKYNLQGRVCLLNSIFWGALGVVFINYIHPFTQEILGKIEIKYIIILDIILIIYLITDTVISSIKVMNINSKLEKIEEINKKIKEKLEELKQLTENIDKKEATEKLQQVLEELKQKREQSKEKLYVYVAKLKKAFPTISSENITKILNEKVEKMKENIKKKDI